MAINLNVRLGAVYQCLFEPWTVIGLHGGRGTGKSHAVAEALTVHSMQRQEVILCVRQYQASIDDSSKSLLEYKIKKLGVERYFWVGKKEIRCELTDSVFLFYGLERNVDSIKSIPNITKTWIEEARNISDNSLEVLIPTVLREPGSQLICTWNPVEDTDAIEKYLRGSILPPRAKVVHVTHKDNPYFDDTELKTQAEHLKAVDYEKYLHIWEGGYYKGGEIRIFNNIKVADIEVPDGIYPMFGLDFGMNKDPNFLVKLYVWDDIVYISAEVSAACDLDDLATLIKGVPGIKSGIITADSSWPQSIAALRRRGYNVLPAIKGPNSIESGISWLQGKKIYISPYCPNMIEESRMYSWKVDKKTKKTLNIPEDTFNHGWDAVRYGTEKYRKDGSGLSIERIGR